MPVISRITAAAIMAIPAKVNTKVPIPPVVGRVKPLLFLTTVVNTPASVVPFVIVVVVVVFPIPQFFFVFIRLFVQVTLQI